MSSNTAGVILSSSSSPSTHGDDNGKRSIAVIDGIRAISFIWIFKLHLLATLFVQAPVHRLQEYFGRETWYTELVLRGHINVDTFNILSGYLLCSAMLQRKTALSFRATLQLIKHRITRLVPIYYVFLLITMCVNVFETIPNAHNVWTNILFINNYFPFQDLFMNHTWSQGLEMQLSILFPLLFYLYARVSRCVGGTPYTAYLWCASLCITTGVVWRFFAAVYLAKHGADGLALPLKISSMDFLATRLRPRYADFYAHLYLPVWNRFTSFAFGTMVAYAVHHKKRVGVLVWCSPVRVVACVLLACIAIVPRLTTHSTDHYYPTLFTLMFLPIHRVVWACSVSLIFYWLLVPESGNGVHWLRTILSWRVWHPISVSSYVGYLFHVLIIGGIHVALKHNHPLTHWDVFYVFVPSFILTFVWSIGLHVYVENPLIHYLRGTNNVIR